MPLAPRSLVALLLIGAARSPLSRSIVTYRCRSLTARPAPGYRSLHARSCSRFYPLFARSPFIFTRSPLALPPYPARSTARSRSFVARLQISSPLAPRSLAQSLSLALARSSFALRSPTALRFFVFARSSLAQLPPEAVTRSLFARTDFGSEGTTLVWVKYTVNG